MKTTLTQLNSFYEFLTKEKAEQDFFKNFRESKESRSFFTWAQERPAEDLLVSAFCWSDKELKKWYELNAKWHKLLKGVQSIPQPENHRETARETRNSGVPESTLDMFRSFLQKENALESYFYNFGYSHAGESLLWEEWAKDSTLPRLYLSGAFDWRQVPRENFDFWSELNDKWKELIEPEMQTYKCIKPGKIKPGLVVRNLLTGKLHTVIFASKVFVILTDPSLIKKDNETVTTIHMLEKDYAIPVFTPFTLTEFVQEKPFERRIKSAISGVINKIEGMSADGVTLDWCELFVPWANLTEYYVWADNSQPVGKAVYK